MVRDITRVFGDLDLSGGRLLNARLHVSSRIPNSPADGQYFWHSLLKKVFVYNSDAGIWEAQTESVYEFTGSGSVDPIVLPYGFVPQSSRLYVGNTFLSSHSNMQNYYEAPTEGKIYLYKIIPVTPCLVYYRIALA